MQTPKIKRVLGGRAVQIPPSKHETGFLWLLHRGWLLGRENCAAGRGARKAHFCLYEAFRENRGRHLVFPIRNGHMSFCRC